MRQSTSEKVQPPSGKVIFDNRLDHDHDEQPWIAAPSASSRPSIASSLITRPRPEPNAAMRTARSPRQPRQQEVGHVGAADEQDDGGDRRQPPRHRRLERLTSGCRRSESAPPVRGPSQPTRPAWQCFFDLNRSATSATAAALTPGRSLAMRCMFCELRMAGLIGSTHRRDQSNARIPPARFL